MDLQKIKKKPDMKTKTIGKKTIPVYEYERQGPAPRAFFGQNRN